VRIDVAVEIRRELALHEPKDGVFGQALHLS
jgi:hypothetical protein